MVAWAKVIASVITLPVGVGLVSNVLGLGRFELFAVMWRPAVSAALMAVVTLCLQRYHFLDGEIFIAAFDLVVFGFASVCTYCFSMFFTWVVCGRPDGIEKKIMTSQLVRRLVSRAVDG